MFKNSHPKLVKLQEERVRCEITSVKNLQKVYLKPYYSSHLIFLQIRRTPLKDFINSSLHYLNTATRK